MICFNSENTAKLLCVASLLLPILFLYSTTISSVTVGDAFLLFSLVMYIATHAVRYPRIPLLFFIFILVQSYYMGEKSENIQIIMTSIRYAVYFFVALTFKNLQIDGEWVARLYVRICYFACGLIIVQTVLLRFFGIALPGVLLFLPQTDESLYDYAQTLYYSGNRCFSVFAEPSHFSIYVLPSIMLELFDRKGRGKKKIISIGVLILGVLTSAAFTGFLGLIAIFLIWLMDAARRKKISSKHVMMLVLGGLAGTVFLLNSNAGRYLLRGDLWASQSLGRFDGYYFLMEKNDTNIIDFLIGHGMEDIGIKTGRYLPGWPRLYYYYGVLGTCLSVYAFIKLKSKGKTQTALLILLGVIMIGTEVNFSPFVLVYLLFVTIRTKEAVYMSNSLNRY